MWKSERCFQLCITFYNKAEKPFKAFILYRYDVRKGIRKSFLYKICNLVGYSVTEIVVTWTCFSDLHANYWNSCSKALTVVCHLNVPMRYTTVIILSSHNTIFCAVVCILKGMTSIKNLFLILDLFLIVRNPSLSKFLRSHSFCKIFLSP